MDLTLLSIAAVLLLLTSPGARAPRFAAQAQDTQAALMRQLFGSNAPEGVADWSAPEGVADWSAPASPRPYAPFKASDTRHATFLLNQHFTCATPHMVRLPEAVRNTPLAEAPRIQSSWTSVRVPRATPRTHSRKQYRTRFGFAEGAYRALAPPLLT